MRNKGIEYILLLAVLLVASCTKEKSNVCPSGVHLHFRFTLHDQPEKGNLFGENITGIQAFIFDKDGILQSITKEKGNILTNDYVMSLDLEPGYYSIIAGASDNENISNTHPSIHAVDLSLNPPSGKELNIGESRMEDLCTLLDCETTTYPEGLKPRVTNFDDLYFGTVGKRSNDGKSQYTIIPIEVKEAEFTEHEIELIRNTNIVRVTVEGLNYLIGDSPIENPEEAVNVWLTGKNFRYQYNNGISPKTPLVRYLAQYTLPAAYSVQADVKTERLEWEKGSDEQVKLYVRLANGKTIYEGDLLDILRQATDGQGNYIYKNQEDLDRIYIHPIRFVIGGGGNDGQDLYLKIFVHDWEVVILNPGKI